MKKQKSRDEIDNNYKWDLTTIYKTEQDFFDDLKNIEEEIIKIENYKGKILDSADSLLEFLKSSDDLERKVYKLYYYSHLNFDSCTIDSKYQEYKGKVDNMLVLYSEKTSFINSEMYNTPYSKVLEYIEENKRLEQYKFNLEDFYRYEKHKLSEEQDKTLSILSNSLNVSGEIFEALTDSDIKFGNIVDEDGNEVELTESNYAIYLRSNNRDVRKNAWERLHTKYGEYKNTLASTFKSNVDYLTSMAKLKRFNSSLEASLYDDNVTPEIYNNLINVINDNMNVIYKYFSLKKEILNLDELHLYDNYAQLIKDLDKKYSFSEAKEIVINALSVLGEDYITNLNKAFDEKWIDVYNN